MRPYDPQNPEGNRTDDDTLASATGSSTDTGRAADLYAGGGAEGDDWAGTTPGAAGSATGPAQGSPYIYNSAISTPDMVDTTRASAMPAVGYATAIGADDTMRVDTGDAGDDDTGGEEPRVEEIRAEIEQTRSEMSSTIDAIQEKLSPANLVEQAKDSVREATIGRVEHMVSDVRDTAREAGSGFMDTVRENPLPAALAAIGIGWLFMKSRQSGGGQDRYRYEQRRYYPTGRYDYDYDREYYIGRRGDQQSAPEKVVDAAGQVGRKVGDVAGQVGQTAGDVVENVQERVGEVGGQVQYTAQRAQGQFERLLYENPLVVGAAALVAGAAVGLLVPETQQEHRILGEARDRLVERAQDVAEEAVDKVSRVAEEAQNAARQEAQSQGLTA